MMSRCIRSTYSIYRFRNHHQIMSVSILQMAAFLSRMLVMDEACFTWNGILNIHNQHTWADENPHCFQETRFQQQFSICVWVGIIGNLLLGPYDLLFRQSRGLLFTVSV